MISAVMPQNLGFAELVSIAEVDPFADRPRSLRSRHEALSAPTSRAQTSTREMVRTRIRR
jgi:hypothetical protein